MAGLEKITLDASVCLKWFVEEDGSESAARILGGIEKYVLFSPVLLIYEVANVLRLKLEFGSNDISEAIRTLYEIQIQFIAPSEIEMTKIIEIAFQFGLTVYDASYVAVAMRTSSPLLTADDRMLTKIKGLKPGLLLGEWDSSQS